MVVASENMDKVIELQKARRADGAACVLAIGTANPPNFIHQKDYPDYYFRVTDSEHLIELKKKFKRICDKTTIRKRHFLLTEDILKANPCMISYGSPSLDARRAIAVEYLPKLSAQAAVKAVEDWGQSKSKITHLLTCLPVVLSMPGLDCEIAKLLELDSSVQRISFHLVGCHSGPQLLRLAMDITKNDKHARVLIVWSEINAFSFHGPSEHHLDALVGQALFGDGAAAAIVGADPNLSIERPLFFLVHGSQMSVIDPKQSPAAEVTEMGQTIHLPMEVPSLVSSNVEECLINGFKPLGITDWNSMFWMTHNAGPKILNQIELALGLEREKLEISRHVLSEYGHMTGAGVILKEGKATTGGGFEWGAMIGYGPGLTIETLVLHSVPLDV